MNYKERITESIIATSRLNDKAKQMVGMSSINVRSLLNNIVSYPDVKYLEIGCWCGSTLYSALYQNNPQYALAIDNFSQFSGSLDIFRNNLSDQADKFDFLNEDSFSVNLDKIKTKFNTYFYDGDHSELSQYEALNYYYPVLEDVFIYICDDWNCPDVPVGTRRAIKENNLKVQYEIELKSEKSNDETTWWNGLWVAVLEK